jgi:hypothetical protein
MPGGPTGIEARSRSRASIDGSPRRVSSPEQRWGQSQLRVLLRQSLGYRCRPEEAVPSLLHVDGFSIAEEGEGLLSCRVGTVDLVSQLQGLFLHTSDMPNFRVFNASLM